MDYIDVANYPDNSIPCVIVNDIDAIVASLENASNTWF